MRNNCVFSATNYLYSQIFVSSIHVVNSIKCEKNHTHREKVTYMRTSKVALISIHVYLKGNICKHIF